MEDSVVTTRSLQWEQRILTVATSKFEKEQISNIQLNSGILNILFKIYLSPHRSYPEEATMSVIPTYVGNVVQNIYYNPIQL